MPQIKPKQSIFFPHNLVLVDVVEDLTRRRITPPENIQWLVSFACYPKDLNHHWFTQEREFFINSFVQQPDLTLEIVTLARKLFAEQQTGKKTERQMALEFFLSHNTLVYRRSKFFLITDPSLTEADRDKPGAYKNIASLTDGEIAQFLNIKTDNVKKARQYLASKGNK